MRPQATSEPTLHSTYLRSLHLQRASTSARLCGERQKWGSDVRSTSASSAMHRLRRKSAPRHWLLPGSSPRHLQQGWCHEAQYQGALGQLLLSRPVPPAVAALQPGSAPEQLLRGWAPASEATAAAARLAVRIWQQGSAAKHRPRLGPTKPAAPLEHAAMRRRHDLLAPTRGCCLAGSRLSKVCC